MTASLAGAVAGFALGTIVGSFLATIIVRWPRGQSALTGRSRCDSCGRTLHARDLLPLVSAVITRGRCRVCGSTIDPAHWRVELLGGLVGAVAIASSPTPAGLAAAVFGWLLIPLAVLDWRHLWLPNRLVLILAIAGVPGGRWLGATLDEQLIGAAAGFASLSIVGALYLRFRGREGLGRGDPKLFGAVGLWTGWQALAPSLVLAGLLGIATALVMRRGGSDPIPFGAMLALAAWPVALLRLA